MQEALRKFLTLRSMKPILKRNYCRNYKFLTMAYILGVNTIILSSAGMDFNSVFLATAISSAIACFVMGLVANAPLGLAPGMGSNSFLHLLL